MVSKLHHSLPASVAKRRTFLKTKPDVGCFSMLDRLTSHQVAVKVVQLLPALCEHMDNTHAYFQAQIVANDGMVDGPGSGTQESQLMARCYLLQLQSLQSIFSWSGFQIVGHRNLLKEGLCCFASRNKDTNTTQSSLHELTENAFNYLESFTVTIPSLVSAVTLLKLISVIESRSESTDLKNKISTMSVGFLQRDWRNSDGEREKGAKHNELLQQLLGLLFQHTGEKLVCIEDLATVGMSELMTAESKDGASEKYPCLTKNSYSVFYKVLLHQLVECSKDLGTCKQSDSNQLKMDHLLQWNMIVRIFHILVNLIKVFDGRTNLGTVLKYGKQFLEVFLKSGMPLLDDMFRNHRDDVQGLLKTLQTSTRALHHVCGHSKIMKDISLTNQVPLLKKSLESFVYRVKAMLTLNKCLEAFWLGNLKNRDLQGEEILSQSTIAGSSRTGDSDNDSLPAEDDDGEDSEVEVDQGETTRDQNGQSDSDGESYSEMF